MKGMYIKVAYSETYDLLVALSIESKDALLPGDEFLRKLGACDELRLSPMAKWRAVALVQKTDRPQYLKWLPSDGLANAPSIVTDTLCWRLNATGKLFCNYRTLNGDKDILVGWIREVLAAWATLEKEGT